MDHEVVETSERELEPIPLSSEERIALEALRRLRQTRAFALLTRPTDEEGNAR
jgi:hypothetical protein